MKARITSIVDIPVAATHQQVTEWARFHFGITTQLCPTNPLNGRELVASSIAITEA